MVAESVPVLSGRSMWPARGFVVSEIMRQAFEFATDATPAEFGIVP
jgi:hypothetical protein